MKTPKETQIQRITEFQEWKKNYENLHHRFREEYNQIMGSRRGYDISLEDLENPEYQVPTGRHPLSYPEIKRAWDDEVFSGQRISFENSKLYHPGVVTGLHWDFDDWYYLVKEDSGEISFVSTITKYIIPNATN